MAASLNLRHLRTISSWLSHVVYLFKISIVFTVLTNSIVWRPSMNALLASEKKLLFFFYLRWFQGCYICKEGAWVNFRVHPCCWPPYEAPQLFHGLSPAENFPGCSRPYLCLDIYLDTRWSSGKPPLIGCPIMSDAIGISDVSPRLCSQITSEDGDRTCASQQLVDLLADSTNQSRRCD